MVLRLGEGHMPCNFFLSEPQLKTTVLGTNNWEIETYRNKVEKCNLIFIKSTTLIINYCNAIESIVVLIPDIYH